MIRCWPTSCGTSWVLYVNPSHHDPWCYATDEKSSIQARKRSQPILPMLHGRLELRTHDYKRDGTTSFFAASDVVSRGPRRSFYLPRLLSEERGK